MQIGDFSQPYGTWTTQTTRTATFEEKAELVFALLIGKVDRDLDVTLALYSTTSFEAGQVTDISEDADRVLIRIRDDARFTDIVEELYSSLSNIRGRQLR